MAVPVIVKRVSRRGGVAMFAPIGVGGDDKRGVHETGVALSVGAGLALEFEGGMGDRERRPDRSFHPFADYLSLFEGRVTRKHEMGGQSPDLRRQTPHMEVVNFVDPVDIDDRGAQITDRHVIGGGLQQHVGRLANQPVRLDRDQDCDPDRHCRVEPLEAPGDHNDHPGDRDPERRDRVTGHVQEGRTHVQIGPRTMVVARVFVEGRASAGVDDERNEGDDDHHTTTNRAGVSQAPDSFIDDHDGHDQDADSVGKRGEDRAPVMTERARFGRRAARVAHRDQRDQYRGDVRQVVAGIGQ